MEIDVVEESKRNMVFELKGEGHTLANMLEKELWNDNDVKAAGYFVEHPLIGIPRILVETKSLRSARKALENAAKRLKKQSKEFSTSFKKVVK